MLSLAQALDGLRRLSPELGARHGARIGVFGSLARGEAKPGAGVDVLG
ncbi:MAG: nucleotidyltransferase domain-containing protein, partial [Candidatus Limnocylindrus sp.]